MKKLVMILGAVFCVTSVWSGDVLKSTLDDQKSIAVTVYNTNLGMVKDVRGLALPVGQGELRFMDVASQIKPETVLVKSLNASDQLQVLEQNYEYDLMSYGKILDKYVGKELTLVSWREDEGKTVKEEQTATLLSNANSNPIFEIDGDIYLGYERKGGAVLPKLPDDLIAKPTLTWMYANASANPHEVEVSYLTHGIGWKADYVLSLNKDDTLADLSGWVTVDNQSGATYRNAKLTLVAGDVNQVQPSHRNMMTRGMVMEMQTMAMADSAGFQEQRLFEYHSYDLGRRTTIKENQTKQISLLEAFGISVEKELVVYGQQGWYSYMNRGDLPKLPVNVYIKFKNEDENNLGMPLPKGIIRVYKNDANDQLQFVGENTINHTPKDEEVKIKVGDAFDVVVERKQTDYTQVARNVHQTSWELTIRNHKDEAITVGLVEPFHGDWRIIQQSHPSTKKDAFTAQFDVEVPPDGEQVVTYTVQVSY